MIFLNWSISLGKTFGIGNEVKNKDSLGVTLALGIFTCSNIFNDERFPGGFFVFVHEFCNSSTLLYFSLIPS